MKQILTIAFMLVCATISAQDTLCVMITLDEIINFDYETSEVINRFNHEGDYQLKIDSSEILCLHFSDEKKRFRDVTTTFSDGDHMHNTFNSEDNVIFSKEDWGDFTINISEPRRKK